MEPRIDALFGRRVREERQALARTQEDVAAELSALVGYRVEKSALSKLEKGTRGVRLAEAAALADILGIALRELLADDPVEARLGETRAELDHARRRRERLLVEAGELEGTIGELEQLLDELEEQQRAAEDLDDLAATTRTEQYPG